MSKDSKTIKKRSGQAAGIFDLFKEIREFTVVGPDGSPAFTVWMRSLDYGQNTALQREMDDVRTRVNASLEGQGVKANLSDQTARLTREQVTQNIIDLERPLVQEQSDLAPGADPEKITAHEEAVAKEKEAIAKWEETRRAELAELADKDVRELAIERQARLLANSRVINEFLDLSLVHMITQKIVCDCKDCVDKDGKPKTRPLHPVTYEEMFSDDPDDENWFGRLSQQVRDQLVSFRVQFLLKKDEKSIRAVAESGSFLPSGKSPEPPADSPGETIETPSDSQPTLPLSTPVASGATT